jgi:hypothetical protein
MTEPTIDLHNNPYNETIRLGPLPERKVEIPVLKPRSGHPEPDGLPDRTPIKVGEVWENPVNRERAMLLELPWENQAGRVTAELTALVGARVVGEHRHPALVERFTTLEGELTVNRGHGHVAHCLSPAPQRPSAWRRAACNGGGRSIQLPRSAPGTLAQGVVAMVAGLSDGIRVAARAGYPSSSVPAGFGRGMSVNPCSSAALTASRRCWGWPTRSSSSRRRGSRRSSSRGDRLPERPLWSGVDASRSGTPGRFLPYSPARRVSASPKRSSCTPIRSIKER